MAFKMRSPKKNLRRWFQEKWTDEKVMCAVLIKTKKLKFVDHLDVLAKDLLNHGLK